MKRLHLAIVSFATLALTACGQPAPKQAAAPSPVGVYTSASDCAASGKLSEKDCNTLIQIALNTHQQQSKTYISQRLCEETEGPNRCERTDPKTFRRALLAFEITFSKAPTSIPLYPSKEKGKIGFTTLDNRDVLIVDETVSFSKDAVTVAQGNSES